MKLMLVPFRCVSERAARPKRKYFLITPPTSRVYQHFIYNSNFRNPIFVSHMECFVSTASPPTSLIALLLLSVQRGLVQRVEKLQVCYSWLFSRCFRACFWICGRMHGYYFFFLPNPDCTSSIKHPTPTSQLIPLSKQGERDALQQQLLYKVRVIAFFADSFESSKLYTASITAVASPPCVTAFDPGRLHSKT